MPARSDALEDCLSRYREIKIRVTGRNSGRAISIPIWFVLDDEKLYLLPAYGSDTQWYKNVLKNPSIQINAGALRLNSTSFLSMTPPRCRPSSRNSGRNTGTTA
jgi:hypothetical protein